MKVKFFWLVLLSYCPIIGNAQTATYKALAYDTLLATATRRGEVTNRLNYREMVSDKNHEQTNVVFIYEKNKCFYTKIFIIKHGIIDSLVAYPEQKLISQKLYNICAKYFAKVLHYQKIPRYEYRRTNEPPEQVYPYPQWIIRVVSVEPLKRPFTAMYSRMDPHDYQAEDATVIYKMNRDFAVLQKAMHEYAAANNIPVMP